MMKRFDTYAINSTPPPPSSPIRNSGWSTKWGHRKFLEIRISALTVLVSQDRQRTIGDLQLLDILVSPTPRVRLGLKRHAGFGNRQRAHFPCLPDVRRPRVPVPDLIAVLPLAEANGRQQQQTRQERASSLFNSKFHFQTS